MAKIVWDVKANFETYKNEAVYDGMIAEFLLSYGKSNLTQESVLLAYGVSSLEELAQKQQAKFLELPKIQSLFAEVEMPLASVLWSMEQHGILLDVSRLKIVGEEINTAIQNIEEALKKDVGHELNLNSAVQVGNYLAEKAGVPLAKTKTGRYATNEQELSQHAAQFPIISKLLTYRELSKLRSTYVDSLISKVDEHGRVHTTYHQVAVNTGRLASTNPNMQNIPVTSVFGLKIKSCFAAPEGKTLLSFDYSQQELRILAHLTGEEKLIEAFNENRDVHKTTASLLFGIDYKDITKEQRNIAKTINFGIIYGMSSYGMSMGLRIPVEEAQKFIDTFFATYPKIKTYYDSYLKEGKINGYVETILGRRRNTFDDGPPSFARATGGRGKLIDNNLRRVLINYPIQGSAADLMKKAMVKVHEIVSAEYPEVKMLLQIHDDLVFEIDDDEQKIREFTAKIRNIMCTVYPLAVPIEVDVKKGKRWGEMELIT